MTNLELTDRELHLVERAVGTYLGIKHAELADSRRVGLRPPAITREREELEELRQLHRAICGSAADA